MARKNQRQFKTVMEAINSLESKGIVTVKDFNNIFRGSPITHKDQSTEIIFGELTTNECRNLYLSDGRKLVNRLKLQFRNLENYGDILKVKYVYKAEGQYYKTLKALCDEYCDLDRNTILNYINLRKPIKKYQGLVIEKVLSDEQDY